MAPGGVSGAEGFYVARLAAGGARDVSFTDLAAHTWEPGFLQEQADCGLRTMPDGRLLVVRHFGTGFVTRRWLADLSAEDPRFNRDADGLAVSAAVAPFENVTGAMFRCISTHVQADGRILIAGHAYGAVPGLENAFGLVRLRGGEY